MDMVDHSCCSHSPIRAEEAKRIAALQSRIDDLLSGTPRVEIAQTDETSRLFSTFRPEDKAQAGVISALCSKIVEEVGGLAGLEEAVDELYDSLKDSPRGMVEHATKLWLT